MSIQRRYVTVDVFTDRIFGGNPLAVVLDGQSLNTAQMQAIATEFNYAETTFILPPRVPAHSAHVRIFTSRTEVPFAGHPNVGTAVVFAREREGKGGSPLDRLIFEETAGLVPIRLKREQGVVVGAEFTAPEGLTKGPKISAGEIAECLSLTAADISLTSHPPQVLSVGLPFLVAEVTTQAGLRRAKPNALTHERVLAPIGTDAIYCYCRTARPQELHARMFSPLDGIVEDPATGSAAGAIISLLAALRPEHDLDLPWRIHQGVEMGRPSLISGRTEKRNGAVTAVHIGGFAVQVMSGLVDLPEP
jgi:trans-2,3-dihydro-3-hydroxyanthranilate isomerase